MISEQLILPTFQEQTYGASDFRDDRVKTCRSLVNEKVSRTSKANKHGVDFSSRLLGCLPELEKKIDPNIYSVKMLKALCLLMEESESRGQDFSEYSLSWMDWGTMQNGRFSTAKIGAFPKTEKGYSLLDILEDEPVADKYFLSDQQTEKILLNSNRIDEPKKE